MFVDQLAHLEEFLKANRMTHTLQTLRQELAAKIPQQPSSQLVSLIDAPKAEHDKQQQKQEISRRKKP